MHDTLRILDANLNRAREGLRTAEEYARFILNDEGTQAALRAVRKGLEDVVAALGAHAASLLEARNVAADVGIDSTMIATRKDAADVALAGLKRAQEALRVIEEYAPLLEPKAGPPAAQARYDAYALEQRLFSKPAARAPDRPDVGRHPLMVIVTRRLCVRSWRSTLDSLFAAGARCFQLREKKITTAEFCDYASEFVERVRHEGGLTLVNDRADIAFAINADGVHLGQEDLAPRAARKMLGPKAIIGVSAHNAYEAAAAERIGVDYIGLGAMFPTKTKDVKFIAGPALLREIKEKTRLPVYAIGGIRPENLPTLIKHRCTHAAVCSAIIRAPDPGQMYRDLLKILDTDDEPPAAKRRVEDYVEPSQPE